MLSVHTPLVNVAIVWFRVGEINYTITIPCPHQPDRRGSERHGTMRHSSIPVVLEPLCRQDALCIQRIALGPYMWALSCGPPTNQLTNNYTVVNWKCANWHTYLTIRRDNVPTLLNNSTRIDLIKNVFAVQYEYISFTIQTKRRHSVCEDDDDVDGILGEFLTACSATIR